MLVDCDLMGLQHGLHTSNFKNSPGDSNMQQSSRTTVLARISELICSLAAIISRPTFINECHLESQTLKV